MQQEQSIILELLTSAEPSIRYLVRTRLLDENPESEINQELREEIRKSPRVQSLLAEQQMDGTLPYHPYFKWAGAHWVLAMLAELGFPPGDTCLLPLREQTLDWLLGEHHTRENEKKRHKYGPARIRRCASQESYAIYALLTLGLADERIDILLERLLECQWPDGGWNCDKNLEADTSSFHETWLPVRALALAAHHKQAERLKKAALKAAEIFLQRGLFRRLHGGEIMHPGFMQLHYPFYWRYTVLSGLKTMAEIGLIHDPRCSAALDWLESRCLPTGGFPADVKFYRLTESPQTSGSSLVGWGKTNGKSMNEFVTAEALAVLHAAGRV